MQIAGASDTAAVSAVDVAQKVADEAEPRAAELNRKIEGKAAQISAQAEPKSHEIADQYQKTAKVLNAPLQCLLLGTKSCAYAGQLNPEVATASPFACKYYMACPLQ